MASLFTNDVFFGMNINTEKGDHQTYVAKIRNQMTSGYSLTLKEAERIVSKKKENYDQRFKFAKLEIWDRMLVWEVGVQGKDKLTEVGI